jgi:subtilisin
MIRASRFFAFLALGLVVTLLGSNGSRLAAAGSNERMPHRYIVVLADDAALNGARRVPAVNALSREHSSRYGARIRQSFKWAFRGYTAEMSARDAARIARDPRVAWVEPVRRILATSDDADPAASASRILNHQTLPTGVDRVQADHSPTARINRVDQRVNVDVAVVDTGIDVHHRDLKVAGGTSCIRQPSFDDQNGHGTRVGGVIAALDNRRGVVGVAPGARLWAVRVFDAEAVGTLETALCGIEWVTRTRLDARLGNDIEVANMSFGTPPQPARVEDGNCGRTFRDVFHVAICRSTAAGVTYVAAAGNDSANVAHVAPAGYREVIAVSALADFDGRAGARGRPSRACTRHLGEAVSFVSDDAFAFFSNSGRSVELIAPGVCILSTYLGGTYALASETSLSAPHVTGGAALYKATHPAASPASVRAALIGSGRFDWNDEDDPDLEKEPLLSVARF